MCIRDSLNAVRQVLTHHHSICGIQSGLGTHFNLYLAELFSTWLIVPLAGQFESKLKDHQQFPWSLNRRSGISSNRFLNWRETHFSKFPFLSFNDQILGHRRRTGRRCQKLLLFTLRGGLLSGRRFLSDPSTPELIQELTNSSHEYRGNNRHRGRALEYHD